jgi:hypothetical protein
LSRSTSSEASEASPGRRGRPPKFGRPGHAVSLTLPEDTLQELNRVHPDTGWAIVKLLERERNGRPGIERDVELARIGPRRSLIVVNRSAFQTIPGVNLIPFTDTHAFLALDPGHGLSDLELVVIDRLADGGHSPRERAAFESLRTHLAAWRHDERLRFHNRSIIVVEEINGSRRGSTRNGATRPRRKSA